MGSKQSITIEPPVTKLAIIKEARWENIHWVIVVDWTYTQNDRQIRSPERVELVAPELSIANIMAQLSEPIGNLDVRWKHPISLAVEPLAAENFELFVQFANKR